jgi:hypothetical protein
VLDVRLLNERHGSDLVAAGAYAGGEVGATRLVDGRGRRFVLKSQPAGLAPATTDALRAHGYPAPRFVFWGDGYHVQEELPGTPIETLGRIPPDLPQRLLELNELQAGRAVDGDMSWPARVIESVLVGFHEYMVLATLDRCEATRRLLRLCQRAVERHAGALTATRDIVHWDFTYHNILCADARVTGVIDWGGTCSGDRLFDLATLVYYAADAHPSVADYVVDRIGHEGLSVYLAHLAIRQSD